MIALIIYFAILFLFLSVAWLLLRRKSHELQSATWEELISRIKQVPPAGIEQVALDILQPQANQLRLEPADMWNLLGGIEGLRSMKQNAQILIALAAYVRRWNFEEAVIVSERMRRDAVGLKRAVFHIETEMFLHSRWLRVPFYMHEAAAAYYLMSKRLLALYETSHVGLLPRLREVLQALSETSQPFSGATAEPAMRGAQLQASL